MVVGPSSMLRSDGPTASAAAAATAGRHDTCSTRPRSGARGRRSRCALPGQMGSKSPSRSQSGTRSSSASRRNTCIVSGSLGCILPGQVLADDLEGSKDGLIVGAWRHTGSKISTATSSSSCSAPSADRGYCGGSTPAVADPYISNPVQVPRVDPREVQDRGPSSNVPPLGHDTASETAFIARGIPRPSSRSSTSSRAEIGDVDRLIARCMTQERAPALVQASAALLDACALKLGEEALEGEKKKRQNQANVETDRRDSSLQR